MVSSGKVALEATAKIRLSLFGFYHLQSMSHQLTNLMRTIWLKKWLNDLAVAFYVTLICSFILPKL
jgi:hypothetical protein